MAWFRKMSARYDGLGPRQWHSGGWFVFDWMFACFAALVAVFAFRFLRLNYAC